MRPVFRNSALFLWRKAARARRLLRSARAGAEAGVAEREKKERLRRVFLGLAYVEELHQRRLWDAMLMLC